MSILREAEGGMLFFWCPGCDEAHGVNVGPNGWTWNGIYDMPTFAPSILVRSGHYASSFKDSCWCTYNAEHPDNPTSFKCRICHSFVTGGKIQFLSDCSHHLAGQTVPLPDFP